MSIIIFYASGTKTSSEFEEVLHEIKYVNVDPKNFTGRSFTLVCRTENDRFTSNKLEITVSKDKADFVFLNFTSLSVKNKL